MEVTLEWYELAMAAEIGTLRQIEALRAGKRMTFGARKGSGWSLHVEGAAGELAVAKALGIYWDGSVNTFKRPDVANLHVRTRSASSWDLIVRDGDDDDGVFVLVTGTEGKYRVVGWIIGRDAKRPEWSQRHGGRTAAYFVPQDALHPFETIPLGRTH